MGPFSLERLTALGVLLAAAPVLSAQVFVVGMKTATADAITEFHPTHVELPGEPLDNRGKLELLRNLEAEQGFAHRELPLGAGLTLIANGNMTPGDEQYKAMLYKKGGSAAPGERIEVSALTFRPDRIVIDFNGGPYAKHRFLSHVQINDIPLAPRGPDPTGCRITLIFEGGVPEVTAAEVKALLDPLVDFKAHTSSEAYANTLSPLVRDAVDAHEILVGMDRRMVLASVGEPRSKHRERAAGADDSAPMSEEWIYGDTPQPVRFVRFREGRVVRMEVAALGQPLEIHDKNEIGDLAAPGLLARTIRNGDPARGTEDGHAPAPPPTLRLPGETSETPSTLGRVHMPEDDAKTPAH